MSQKIVMGNEAIALGAIRAGVGVVCGYPGTPSSEILETVAKNNVNKDIYVEWSVNEKVAMELGAGAAYSGVRTMVTMKQVGLNVAADPLMSLEYVGVKGGMVIVVADDPGPISSQTEQDTRHYGYFSKVPVFDPSSVQEAYDLVQTAFEYSEKYGTPVFLRPTTRVCHGRQSIDVHEDKREIARGEFEKSSRWVIFPKLSYENHKKIVERNEAMSQDFSKSGLNPITGSGKCGIACGGVSYSYVKEALKDIPNEVRLFKITTPHPFPEDSAREFLSGLERVLVIEELDPVIEEQLHILCGKDKIDCKILGKLTSDIQNAGENTVEAVKNSINVLLGNECEKQDTQQSCPLPMRPPTLCAGCPHRGAFYAVKAAMKGRKSAFCGDIGCYTLGNAAPLNMVDTCLCMGGGITVSQGIKRAEPGIVNFAFIGDSTFFHSGITGIVNAVYNQTDLIAVILDNRTTAMTGHQPHPGIGVTMMGDKVPAIDIATVLQGCGVTWIKKADPLNFKESVAVVQDAAEGTGVRAIIFEAPCIALFKPEQQCHVEKEECTGCKACINKIGCPALYIDGDVVAIDNTLCYGCTLCSQICPFHAIKGGSHE